MLQNHIDYTTPEREAAGPMSRNAHIRGVSFWFKRGCAVPIVSVVVEFFGAALVAVGGGVEDVDGGGL